MPWLPLDGAAAVARWCRDVRVKGSRWESWCSEYVTSQATAAERSVFVGRWKNEGFLAARLHVDEAWSRLRGSLPSAEECWPLLEGAMAAGESSGSRRAAGDVVGGQARQMQRQSRYRCTKCAVGELREKRRRVERVSDGSRCRRGSQRQRQRACRVRVASANNRKMSQ
ncbi:hypothetical protein HBI65_119410 [Parastagonospora nodorum]|nr:hypothetical protein HBH52_177520 [Parastagonospora nodorum]KAH5370170.1 hypothetical protein HBI33_176510 [Parastagonospora nodorum]KAH6095155.1 hypothetical protein HBI65_119410 [Parastagonospora nodorum]